MQYLYESENVQIQRYINEDFLHFPLVFLFVDLSLNDRRKPSIKVQTRKSFSNMKTIIMVKISEAALRLTNKMSKI